MTDQDDVTTRNRFKFGLTFHRTFPLVRPAVTSVLGLAVDFGSTLDTSKKLTLEDIRENTNLGTVYVEAMPRYAKAMGLLDDLLQPTKFGTSAYKYDPLLEQSSTQWLMHYHICASQGLGPIFWNRLVTDRFRSGNRFTRDEISKQIADIISETEGRSVNRRDSDITATVFLNTYTKLDGFGSLEILEKVGDSNYQVLDPEAPSIWVMAYALLDYWEASFPQQMTVNLSELTGAKGLTGLFLTGSGRLNTVLRAMQEDGYVEVHRVAPPFQVVVLDQNRDPLLDRIYSYE